MIHSSVEQVFSACVVPAALNVWWTKKCSGEPTLGAEYMFWFSPEYDWRAVVSEVKLNEFISFRFRDADEDWTDTVLTMKVEEKEKGVLLHLIHRDWKHANEHFGRTNFCWAMYLNKLKEYTENN